MVLYKMDNSSVRCWRWLDCAKHLAWPGSREPSLGWVGGLSCMRLYTKWETSVLNQLKKETDCSSTKMGTISGPEEWSYLAMALCKWRFWWPVLPKQVNSVGFTSPEKSVNPAVAQLKCILFPKWPATRHYIGHPVIVDQKVFCYKLG